jgi:pteridine reductase
MSNYNHSLEGRVALVTGAAHRIGASIARTLHRAGMNVAVHYRRSRDAAEALQAELNGVRPDSIALFPADLLATERLPRLVGKVLATWGRLDVLVNNASSFYPTPVGSATEADWDELLGSNLKAPFFLSQAAAPHLKACQGCIVNVADIHGERPLKEHPIYSVAKAGKIMLTKALARELGPEVRVNAVAPGAILWPERGLDEVTRQRIINGTALKRQGTPQEIANAVLFLIRDADYVSGHVLAVDGGRTLCH